VQRRSAPRHLADVKNALCCSVIRVFGLPGILSKGDLSKTCQNPVRQLGGRLRHFCQKRSWDQAPQAVTPHDTTVNGRLPHRFLPVPNSPRVGVCYAELAKLRQENGELWLRAAAFEASQ
jgi:hypothetical protein